MGTIFTLTTLNTNVALGAYITLGAYSTLRPYITLGTDGFGRSDTRKQLRNFFEVDRHFIVVASLYALVLDGELEASVVDEAIKRFDIDPAKANPLYC